MMTGLKPANGVALWRQIEDTLRAEIAGGALPPGARLAGEHAMARRFSVNRHTVRQAIQALADAGLVHVEHGRGTFVADVVLDYPIRERTSFSANLSEQGRLPSHRLLAVAEGVAEAAIAAALDLAPGDPIITAETISAADGIPLSFSQGRFAKARFPDLAARYAATTSVTELFKSYGIAHYRRKTTRITTRMPSAAEADALRQAKSEPVLLTESIDVDPDGRPLRHGLSCFAGARVQLVVDND